MKVIIACIAIIVWLLFIGKTVEDKDDMYW
jgi:hypothetical protein